MDLSRPVNTPRSTAPKGAQVARRDVLVLGASAMALAAGGVLFGAPTPARAAPSPRLPGEVGRQNGLVSRYAGTVFDHVKVTIDGDGARLFIPQGIVPGATAVPVLWLYHGAGSNEDALLGGFRGMGERAVDLGMIAVCQSLGGTLYTAPRALELQVKGWQYMSGLYGVDRNFLRGTSHGGSMAVEVPTTDLIPHVVGSYIVNGVYDIEDLYLNGTAQGSYSVGQAFGYDLAAIRAHNPARHTGTAWAGTRTRVVYSQPDSSDLTTPPLVHAKALLAAAAPFAIEASSRTHTSGHNTPSFADTDNVATISRWMDEIVVEPPEFPVPVAAWSFAEAAAPFASSAGGPALQQGAGSQAARVTTPFGGGVQFNGTSDYLKVARSAVGPLNVGASTGAVTVAAWVFSTDTNNAMLAGCWQEATPGERSYALFNDLPTYGGDDRVCMHVSKTGGATPGYPNSIDYAADPRRITRGSWQFHVGTYDGAAAVAYLDGTAASFPSYTDSKGATYAKNPYAFTAGLNATPTDFLVGAGLRAGSPVNAHRGVIAKLRVWNAALTADQVRELYENEREALEQTPQTPVPAPIADWSFAETAAPYASSIPGSPALQLGTGAAVVRVATPFGGGVSFNGTTDYLRVPASSVGALNIGATTNAVTVAAWVRSDDTNNANIAGCWDESRTAPQRSYALFNDLPVYGGDDMVCMEVSRLGGATPGYPYSIDYAAEPRKMTRGAWQLHVGTYDGEQAMAYLDGISTAYPSYTDSSGATYAKNPYAYPDGLYATPTEFIVGAVKRSGSLINLHKGAIAKLRVWNTALTPAQVKALYDAERGALG